MEDDNDSPHWLAVAWQMRENISHLLAKPNRVLRIATVKPSDRALLDRLLWCRGNAPSSDLFAMAAPKSEVPQGWRFAFPVGASISHTDIAHLRDLPFSHLLKLQVLELGAHIAEAKQVIFDPAEARVIKEFPL